VAKERENVPPATPSRLSNRQFKKPHGKIRRKKKDQKGRRDRDWGASTFDPIFWNVSSLIRMRESWNRITNHYTVRRVVVWCLFIWANSIVTCWSAAGRPVPVRGSCK
jgi:hypothetical protein